MSRFIKKILFYILVSLLLVLVYPLDLHFPTGNQCIYFFWGIKNTSLGFLENDFLATQADPFPFFSLVVMYSSKLFGNSIFLIWYWLINLVYVVAVFEIAEEASSKLGYKLNKILFTALFLFVNSTLVWGFFFSRFFNFDLRWAWDSGFAEQGILRGYFQPSSFGVFILLSLMLFIKRKFLLAFVSAAIASCFHANYLLVSAVFVCIYILTLIKEKNYKTAITGSVFSILLVLPYLVYVNANFGSSSPETIDFIKSHIKGHIHFDYRIWVNSEAFLQLTLIIISSWLMRKTVLVFPILFSLITLIALTLLTYISGNIFLMNLTPWRISVILVPLAVAVILAYLSSVRNTILQNLIFSLIITSLLSTLYFRVFGNNSVDYIFRWRIYTVIVFAGVYMLLFIPEKYYAPLNFRIFISVLSVLLVLMLGLSGILLHKKDRTNENELMAFSKTTLSSNQQYIIPPALIDFRIITGAPVFVDSCIYHSNALPEWEKKINIVDRLYSSDSENTLALLDSLAENCGITHIITTNELTIKPGKEIFQNERYTIFELNKHRN